MVDLDDIRAGARALGLPGAVCLHVSIRSFGGLSGGPTTLVDGLLTEGHTVLVPTFSINYSIPPPADDRPARNGVDYERIDSSEWEWTAGRYSPDATDVESWLGATPAHVASRPDRIRGASPTGSFSAVGPLARELVVDERRDIFGPLRALRRLGGSVVLMGVGLNRLTLLHLAEVEAGRRPFIRWAIGPDGEPMREMGGECSEGFPNLEPDLAPLASETTVGGSSWRSFPAGRTLELASSRMREEPSITRCQRAECIECPDAIAGGPIG